MTAPSRRAVGLLPGGAPRKEFEDCALRIVLLANWDRVLIQWELRTFRQFPPTVVLAALLASTLSVFRTRAALPLEILALRHQLGVMQRSVKKPKLNPVWSKN